MSGFARSPFAAVVRTELRFNRGRIAPYALMVVFGANAVLWWAVGPAVSRGWATNSDFFIARLFGGFTLMTLPFFIALMMGDPVVRDFDLNVDPLIFSKPLGRAEYLLGKFCGNFLVLLACEASFALVAALLQPLRTTGMVVLPARVTPYVTHFVVLVAGSTLLPAAICFCVGTLTRSVKVVYGLVASSYVLYIAWQEWMLKALTPRWRVLLDPLLFNAGGVSERTQSAEALNQLAITYGRDVLINRALVLLAAALCLAITYACFGISLAHVRTRNEQSVRLDIGGSGRRRVVRSDWATPLSIAAGRRSALSSLRAYALQLYAALIVELRLLSAERALLVVVPLIVLASMISLARYGVEGGPSPSAAYAARAVGSLPLFLCAMAVFFVGEAMHRDRERRIDGIVWSTSSPNGVFLLSKAAATILVASTVSAVVEVGAVVLQTARGATPVALTPYVVAFVVVVLPSITFVAAFALAAHVVMRDKYLSYALCVAVAGASYYVSGVFGTSDTGGAGWLVNPLLTGPGNVLDRINDGARLPLVVMHRLYVLALASCLLSTAHLCYVRRAARGFRTAGRFNARAHPIAVLLVSLLLSFATGLELLRLSD